MSATIESGGGPVAPAEAEQPKTIWMNVAVVVVAVAATAFAVFMQMPMAIAGCGAIAFSLIILLDLKEAPKPIERQLQEVIAARDALQRSQEQLNDRVLKMVPTIFRVVGDGAVQGLAKDMGVEGASSPDATSTPKKESLHPQRQLFNSMCEKGKMSPIALTLRFLEKA